MGPGQQGISETLLPNQEVRNPGQVELNLKGKRVCVFGLQGSGKTIWTKNMALRYRTLVIDILGEYNTQNYFVVRPEAKQLGPQLAGEFQQAMDEYVFSKKYQWDMLVIDEASQYFPPKPAPLHPAMMRLNDFNRHMGLAFTCVARRPTQLHSDLTELAHYNIFFKLTGLNDMKRLRDMYPGLDAAVFSLGPREFIVYETGKRFYKCKPIAVA